MKIAMKGAVLMCRSEMWRRPKHQRLTDRSKRWLEVTPPTTTVRVRRYVGKRRQPSPTLSAPRPQPKRPRGLGALPCEGGVVGARLEPHRSCKGGAGARRLPQTKTRAGRASQLSPTWLRS